MCKPAMVGIRFLIETSPAVRVTYQWFAAVSAFGPEIQTIMPYAFVVDAMPIDSAEKHSQHGETPNGALPPENCLLVSLSLSCLTDP